MHAKKDFVVVLVEEVDVDDSKSERYGDTKTARSWLIVCDLPCWESVANESDANPNRNSDFDRGCSALDEKGRNE